MGILSIRRLKFGLEEAERVVETNPSITKEHVKVGTSFIGALDIQVVVVPEAEAKIAELTKSAGVLEEEARLAQEKLGRVPARFKAAVDALRSELKDLMEMIRSVVLARVDEIEDLRDRRISGLEIQIEGVKEGAETEANFARTKGEKRIEAIEKKLNKKIAKIQSRQNVELKDLEYQLANLTGELATAQRKIDKFSKIKDLFA